MKGLAEFLPDTYTRRARIYPFLVAALPLALATLVWFPDKLIGWSAFGSVFVWGGGTALIAQLARDWGRKKQPRLFETWDGKPTTRRLRHRDTDNKVILARRHKKLQELLPDVLIPTAEEELANKEIADEVYEAYGDFLRTKTRDREAFPLVFEENCNYGFRRNLWGMKPLGFTISLVGTVAVGILIVWNFLAEDASISPLEILIGLINLLLFLGWSFVFNPEWVRVPAEAYADQLIAACDKL